MSFVVATTELVRGAAQDLAGVAASLADAAATASGPTTGIAAAAQDEISVAVASVFGDFGREFQARSAPAQSYHTQFVNLLNASAAAYASAEAANARHTLWGGVAMPAAPANGSDPIARWGQVLASTSQNAVKVVDASAASVNTLFSGVATGIGQLATNPAAFFGNVATAGQSVFLVGAPQDLANAVVLRTLGGVTQATNPGAIPPDPTVVPIDDVHVQVYIGLSGQGDFSAGTGFAGALARGLTDFASSPASGVLLGALSPFISPGVALWNSVGSIFADLTNSNAVGAVGHLIDTPANVVDGLFNGATLNLDALAPTFDPFVTGGSEGKEELTGLSLAFGGLFSPGQVVDGPGGDIYYGTGGSMLNALGLNLNFYPPDGFAGGSLSVPPIPVGPIGATAGLLSILGQALGGNLLS